MEAVGDRDSKEKAQEWQAFEAESLSAQDVACGTMMGAGQRHFQRLVYPCIVLDEVAQSTEPESLVPLVQAATEAHVVLVGDEQQLPPTVKSKEAEFAGLGVSLFERLLACVGIPRMQLDTQYRMHPSIVALPNRSFYHSSLKSAAHTKNMRTVKGFPWPCSGVRLVFESGK